MFYELGLHCHAWRAFLYYEWQNTSIIEALFLLIQYQRIQYNAYFKNKMENM